MRKEELKKLRKLYATPAMIARAGRDMPVKTKIGYYGCTYDKYKNGLYMRCQMLGGILKIAFFFAETLRSGGKKPDYDLFINPNDGDFITYDYKLDKWKEAKLDCLEWPQYVYHCGKWINRDGRNNIIRYLGVSNGSYDKILEYQLNVRQRQLNEKRKKETDSWDVEMEQIPGLPKDWMQWVRKTGIPEHYIIYDYKRGGAKEGYCTHCGKMVPIKQPKNYKADKCKCCGSKVVFKALGKMGRGFRTDYHTVYLLQKCRDGFVIREFVADMTVESIKYRAPITHANEIRRTIVDDNMNFSSYTWGMYKQIVNRWIKDYDRGYGYDTWRMRYGKTYGKTIPSLAKKELSRTGLQEMLKEISSCDPEVYLRKLKLKPYVEQLIKAGLVKLAADIINGYESINMEKSNDLAKALQIDKYRMKRLRENNGSLAYIEWLRHEKKLDKIIPDDVIKWFEKEKVYPKDIEFIKSHMSELQICNYIKKQMASYNGNVRQTISTWQDYLAMAKRLKMDVKNEMVYRPKKLMVSHDATVALVEDKAIALKAGEIIEKYPDVDDICAEIKEKYEYEDGTYAVVAPKGIEDILMEGVALSHCMDKDDKYFNRINIRETYILFLRKKEEMDKPYYTLEVEPGGTIRQKRTTGDKQNPDIEDAKKFLEKWQKEIQKRITKEDKAMAAESKRLRIEGYAKLKEDKVKIRGGIFAGQLLAEVLEADLMEIELEIDRKAG